MTDQTIPAGLTRDEAQAVREWAERARSAEVQDETVLHAARVLLAVLPKRPTLADMTPSKRVACQWMQADVIAGHEPLVITHVERSDGTALILDRNGRCDEVPAEEVTPRPDLPRLTWPGDTPAAPALPDGWRLADHKKYGRVIVTSAAPDADGYVYFVSRATGPIGNDWHLCPPDELTYLDQEGDQ